MRSIAPSESRKSRVSSVFDPTISSMSALAPARMASSGGSGRISSSTVGAQGRLLSATSPQNAGSAQLDQVLAQSRLGLENLLGCCCGNRFPSGIDAQKLSELPADALRCGG